jgi:lactoylglutathione lyase
MLDSRDGARLATFYREHLGLPLQEERHGSELHWGCFLAGVHFAIHQVEDAPSAGAFRLSFEVDDVDDSVAELRSQDIPIVEEPHDRPFGRVAAVTDPDGNTVYLHRYLHACRG